MRLPPLFLSLAACALACAAAPLARGEAVVTNAILVNDMPLAVGALKMENRGITLTGELKSDQVVFEVVQGNFIYATHRITYAIVAADKDAEPKELVFICRDTSPAPGSRVRINKSPWPFAKGSRLAFRVTRDSTVSHTPYFVILGYTAAPAPAPAPAVPAAEKDLR